MSSDKFQVKTRTDDKFSVVDVENGRWLDLDNKYHVKQLVSLLNDWHNIIMDKWGLK